MSACLSRRAIFAAMIALAAAPLARAVSGVGLRGRPLDLQYGWRRVAPDLIAGFDCEYAPPSAPLYDLQDEDFLTAAELEARVFPGGRLYRFTVAQRRFAAGEISPLFSVPSAALRAA